MSANTPPLQVSASQRNGKTIRRYFNRLRPVSPGHTEAADRGEAQPQATQRKRRRDVSSALPVLLWSGQLQFPSATSTLRLYCRHPLHPLYILSTLRRCSPNSRNATSVLSPPWTCSSSVTYMYLHSAPHPSLFSGAVANPWLDKIPLHLDCDLLDAPSHLHCLYSLHPAWSGESDAYGASRARVVLAFLNAADREVHRSPIGYSISEGKGRGGRKKGLISSRLIFALPQYFWYTGVTLGCITTVWPAY